MDLKIDLSTLNQVKNSLNKDDEYFDLLSDHSSEELKQIFNKSNLNSNPELSSSLQKFCHDSLSLIKSNQKDGLTTSHYSHETTYINNNDIIEKYTKKLLLLQTKLNENLFEHNCEKENIKTDSIKPTDSTTSSLSKILFKDLNLSKKDAVMKKLLRTIDIMNQELSKRDKLIVSMEKEAKILRSKKKTLSTANKLNNLDMKLLLDQNDLESKFAELEKRFEHHINASASTKYGVKGIESLEILDRINTDLKQKIAKLCEENQKISADEEKNTFDFMELNEKLENLDSENKRLHGQVFELIEKQREVEKSAREINEKMQESYQIELSNIRHETIELEHKYQKTIENFDGRLKELGKSLENSEDDRHALTRILNQNQDEKQELINQLEHYKKFEQRYDDLKARFDLLDSAHFEDKNRIHQLETELSLKLCDREKQSNKTSEELKRVKQALNLNQEKIKYLQTKHENEMQQSRKQWKHDLELMKARNDQAQCRNGELSRSNGELRKKNREIENELKSLNEKYFICKQSSDMLGKQKKINSKELKEEHEKSLIGLRDQVACLEKARDDYLKKNKNQETSIEQMLQQIESFKTEFEQIVKRNMHLEEKYKKAHSVCNAYKEKYHELKQQKFNCKDSSLKSKTSEANLIKSFMRDLRVDCDDRPKQNLEIEIDDRSIVELD